MPFWNNFFGTNGTSSKIPSTDPDVGPMQGYMAEQNKVNPLFANFPRNLIQQEVDGIYGSALLKELGYIVGLYDVYDNGAKFLTDKVSGTDYIPMQTRYRKASSLINKEARFMFSNPPDVTVSALPTGNSKEVSENDKEKTTTYQNLIDAVFKKNHFNRQLVQAARDCFIGRRIAYILNFNNDKGITISFLPSLEFVYEVDDEDINKLTKIVGFFTIVDSSSKNEQRIFKKKYEMHDDGFCYVSEGTYDGLGQMIDEGIEDQRTEFTRIPGGVIINDGLVGDLSGVSDIEEIGEYESMFSRLANADIDAMRKGMNPIRWAKDMDPDSTKNLSISAGAFWDLKSDNIDDDGAHGEVGVLEETMNYSTPLQSTLDRIEETMHDLLEIPDLSSDALKGVVSSGKTLKALYWPLITRCDEKMLAWGPALEEIAELIIEGAKLYPTAASFYVDAKLEDINYEITVENNYALPEDVNEEKGVDLQEVNAQTMSKKTYMQKWRGLTDAEADAELDQIALEQALLQDSSGMPSGSYTSGAGDYSSTGEDDLTGQAGGSQGQVDDTGEEGVDGGTTA